MDFMRPPTDATVWANCIHMLSDMLAQIGRAAQRYSVDHSGESMQIGDYAEVYTAMSSTDQEYSVTPGFTDQATYDAQIMNLCPDFDRSAHVTPEHSANFAGNAPAYQKPKPTGNGGRGGRGCGRGGGRGGGVGKGAGAGAGVEHDASGARAGRHVVRVRVDRHNHARDRRIDTSLRRLVVRRHVLVAVSLAQDRGLLVRPLLRRLGRGVLGPAARAARPSTSGGRRVHCGRRRCHEIDRNLLE